MSWKTIGILAVVIVILGILFGERDLEITAKQYDALRTLCDSNGGLQYIAYRHERDMGNLDFDKRLRPVSVVCKNKTYFSAPFPWKTMN